MIKATPVPRPVIVITSLVASDFVGGAVTQAVLFNAGFQPVFVPTVTLGRHPGRGAPGGGPVDADVIASALAALTESGAVDRAAAIFTGYLSTPQQVEAVAAFIKAARARRPDLPVWVDPILGDGPGSPDNSALYIKPETAAAIRDTLVPAADVITPNLFELAWLSGRTLTGEAETAAAARALAPGALVTSAPAAQGRIGVLALSAADGFALDTGLVAGAPNGTGDLFAAGALAAVLGGASLADAAAESAARVERVLRRTAAAGADQLVLSPVALAMPETRPRLRRLGAEHPAYAMGLDGCPAGWCAVIVDMNGLQAPAHQIFASFQEALDFGAQIVAVDMPIGFADRPEPVGMRVCEREARALLGARRSSIFPSPLRPALSAETYEAALAANRAAGGKGVSKQAWNLFAKMREIDAALTPPMEGYVYETHPETSFAAITGAPADQGKKTPEGRAERLSLLVREGLPAELFDPHPFARKIAAPDDLIDAGLCALTALRIAAGSARSFPAAPPRDARGLRMAIFA